MGQRFSSEQEENKFFVAIKQHLTNKCECSNHEQCKMYIMHSFTKIRADKRSMSTHKVELIKLLSDYIIYIGIARNVSFHSLRKSIARDPRIGSSMMFRDMFSRMNETRDMELFLNSLYFQLCKKHHPNCWTTHQHNIMQRKIALLTHLPLDVSNKCPHCLRDDHTEIEADTCYNVRTATKQKVNFREVGAALDPGKKNTEHVYIRIVRISPAQNN